MQISAIRNSHYSMNTTKAQNFKGLWGKDKVTTKDNTHYNEDFNTTEGEYSTLTHKTYYPFLNESTKSINQARLQNTKESHQKTSITEVLDIIQPEIEAYVDLTFPPAKTTNEGFEIRKRHIDLSVVSTETTVSIMPNLPFDEATYNSYLKRELPSVEELKLEDELKIRGLQEHLLVPPKK